VDIFSDNIKIYVRKSKRFIENELRNFLDLASIQVYNTGEKIFTNLLIQIEKEFPNINLFIESILTERFLEFFLKNNFKLDSSKQNVYKIKYND